MRRTVVGMDVLDRVTGLDRLFVQQKFAPLVNRYLVSAVAADGNSPGEPLCEVRQKRMKIREQITFSAPDADGDGEPVLLLRSRHVFEVRGVTDVLLPGGEPLGALRKVFGASLVRSTWEVQDPSGVVVAVAREASVPIAVLRRIWGQIPYVGGVPFLLPFHFNIAAPDGRPLGTYRRLPALRDRYLLDLSADVERRLDRRVAMALTIALDALQDR